jgi:hypothetical protein
MIDILFAFVIGIGAQKLYKNLSVYVYSNNDKNFYNLACESKYNCDFENMIIFFQKAIENNQHVEESKYEMKKYHNSLEKF